MTVSSQTPLNSYTANGVTTAFSFGFLVLLSTDLVVEVTDTSGNVVTKTLGTDYSVTGVGVTSGGTVTFVTAPPNGYKVVVYRSTALARSVDYQPNGDLPAATLNRDIDRLWLAMQELFGSGKGVQQFLRVPAGEAISRLPAAVARANKGLAFNSSGDPIALALTFGAVTAPVVATIAALRLVSKLVTTYVFVTGYYASGDGGGGVYFYDSTDATTADDGGSVIVAADGGRWKLNSNGVLSIKQFGAKGDGGNDDTTPIRNAFAAWAKLCIANGSAKITAPAGKYKITAIIDVSTYFAAASYYNLEVDFDQGCVFQIASALLPAFRFGAPDGGAFAFGKFNLGSFNGNGFATTCLLLSHIVDSDIRVGSVGGYTGGVGVNCKTTGAAGGLLNNDIYIAALLGGAYGLLCQDAAVTAHAFQGNRVSIGHCTSHTGYGVWMQSLSSSNTVDIASLEANTNGILDQAGYNIYRLNFANGNSINIGSANGRIDVEGYQFTMINSGAGTGRVKDNSVSASPQKPSVPASNANYVNTFQRPATMTVSGGTMNFIAIDGVNLGVLSGSFRVPYGAVVILNYSVAPTWVWTFE